MPFRKSRGRRAADEAVRDGCREVCHQGFLRRFDEVLQDVINDDPDDSESLKVLVAPGRHKKPGYCMKGYRYLISSPSGLVQQLVEYLKRDYFFYVVGQVPEHKDPLSVDQKLIDRYGLAVTPQAKQKRLRTRNIAKVHYLRYGSFFVLVASHGTGPFWEAEAANIRDFRKRPLIFYGYSISIRGDGPHVRIRREEFGRLRDFFHRAALWDESWWHRKLREFPFEPWGGVIRQLLRLHREVNKIRLTARKPPLPYAWLRTKRHPCRVFLESEG